RTLAAAERNRECAARLMAVARVADGMAVMDAAAETGISVSRLTDWVKRCADDGPAALRMLRATAKLERRQLKLARELVAHGPTRAPGNVAQWTVAELRAMLWDMLRVRYSRDGVKKLVKRLGYTWPKR